MQEVVQQLQAEGYPVDEAYFQYLSPSRYEYINQLGKYTFTNPAHLDPLPPARSAIPATLLLSV